MAANSGERISTTNPSPRDCEKQRGQADRIEGRFSEPAPKGIHFLTNKGNSMDVKCDKCGASTSPKEITSKKSGKNYTVYECDGSCMNGKFRYSRFAPNDAYGTPSNTAAAPAGNVSAALRAIDAKLALILSLLQSKSGAGGIQPSEFEPDTESSF